MRWLAAGLLGLALHGCAASLPSGPESAAPAGAQVAMIAPAPQQCVPYARQVSGIALYGDAWTWWDGALGHYRRGDTPRPGGVLVLRRSERLGLGHVAVVTSVLDPRRLLVTHTNWGSAPETRRRVYRDMPVIDVSPDNRWRLVRFWNFDAGAFGQVYPAYGFIYPLPASS